MLLRNIKEYYDKLYKEELKRTKIKVRLSNTMESKGVKELRDIKEC